MVVVHDVRAAEILTHPAPLGGEGKSDQASLKIYV